jgi:hypothetical protein
VISPSTKEYKMPQLGSNGTRMTFMEELAEEFREFRNQEREAMEDEQGAELGDPRRCPRHPNEVTSSPDGMFDAPCGACEFYGEEPESEEAPTSAELNPPEPALQFEDPDAPGYCPF